MDRWKFFSSAQTRTIFGGILIVELWFPLCSLSLTLSLQFFTQTFIVMDGALAFFTFSDDGSSVNCNVLNSLSSESDRVMIVEKKQYHAMTAAPASMGWPGHAIVFETSGHKYDASISSKV